MKHLIVYAEPGQVGFLHCDEFGRMSFEYCESWVRDPHGFPLSASLPYTSDLQTAPAAHRFFANLLPEAGVRDAVCRRLGISANNDFELLARIGGECAGALSVLPEGVAPDADVGDYEEIHPEELASWSRRADGAALAVPHARLSLAGAQDKLAVLIEDSRIYLPLGASASTHLLKLPGTRFRHLPANEVFCGLTLRAAGIAAVTAKLLRLGPIDVVQVTRYDRLRGPGRAVRRLHQEDFCQALGFAPNAKYEEEGGPTLAACHALLRQVSSLPAIDSRAFLSWQVANLLLRNADAHAKNLALVYHQDSGCRLAPFYDVVCTGVYQKLARRLPMRIGGATHSEGIAHRQWLDHARSLGVPGRFLLSLVSDVADRIEAALPRARTTFRERYGDSPILGRILHESRKQIRHTRRLLE